MWGLPRLCLYRQCGGPFLRHRCPATSVTCSVVFPTRPIVPTYFASCSVRSGSHRGCSHEREKGRTLDGPLAPYGNSPNPYTCIYARLCGIVLTLERARWDISLKQKRAGESKNKAAIHGHRFTSYSQKIAPDGRCGARTGTTFDCVWG